MFRSCFKLRLLVSFLFISIFISGIGQTVWALDATSTSGLTEKASPTAKAIDSQTGVQAVYVALPAEELQFLQFYLVQALHFAHSSYGFVAASMRSARKNLGDPMYLVQLEQLEAFIDRTLDLASLLIRKSPDQPRLQKIQSLLKKLKEATGLFRQATKQTPGAAQPDSRLKTSGDIHEQLGKEIPQLFSELESILKNPPIPAKPTNTP
ncbi:MAG: hypothetical protein HQM08_16120 [Candidatus Riflebacteria bacterium]|nr:hypothetical protein [Candidatus Riflebacteria bacterium]